METVIFIPTRPVSRMQIMWSAPPLPPAPAAALTQWTLRGVQTPQGIWWWIAVPENGHAEWPIVMRNSQAPRSPVVGFGLIGRARPDPVVKVWTPLCTRCKRTWIPVKFPATHGVMSLASFLSPEMGTTMK